MKKVGVVTIFNNNNYGASLQAYALQKLLLDWGLYAEVINIDFSTQQESRLKRLFQEPVKIPAKLVGAIGRRIHGLIWRKELARIRLRNQAVLDFEHKNIRASEAIREADLSEISDVYDYVIAGSDQIWNPQYWHAAYFLDFVDDSVPKISYAASTGVSFYTERQCEIVHDFLERFSAVSVREEEGRKLLNGITDKDIQVVLDPVFLLEAAQWDKICAPVIVEGDYLFCYFLGENPAHRKWARQMADQFHLQLVTLSDGGFKPADIRFGDKRLYHIDSGGFLSLIKNAKAVLTDSFHCMAFTIIYQKRLFVVKRNEDHDLKSMNSRIYTTLSMLGLKDRLVDTTDKEWDIKTPLEEIYYHTQERLEKERKKSLDFLKKALEKD